MSYYWHILHPASSLEMDSCIYDNMAMKPEYVSVHLCAVRSAPLPG
jgi:hypothetical protein